MTQALVEDFEALRSVIGGVSPITQACLRPGVDEKYLRSLWRTVGVTSLPSEYVELYSLCNGSGSALLDPVFGWFLPVETAVEDFTIQGDGFRVEGPTALTIAVFRGKSLLYELHTGQLWSACGDDEHLTFTSIGAMVRVLHGLWQSGCLVVRGKYLVIDDRDAYARVHRELDPESEGPDFTFDECWDLDPPEPVDVLDQATITRGCPLYG